MISQSADITVGDTTHTHILPPYVIPPGDFYFNFHTKVSSFMSNNPNLWIVDTDTTDHMCMTSTKLHNNIVELSKPIEVRFAENRITKVNVKGSYKISPKLILHDVLSILSFNVNLLSIGKLATKCNHMTVYFGHDEFAIQDFRGN